jgi:hypothetical protein
MKLKSILCLFLAMCCAASFNGCKKSDQAGSNKEPKVTGNPSDAPVSLMPKWKPGQRYVMRMESAQTMEMPAFAAGRGRQSDGKPVSIENNFSQEYSFAVTNAADGNHGMEMEILAIEIQAGGGGQTINYDSRNTVAREGGPIGEAFDKMIGGKIQVLVSPDNKVLKVEGMEDLFARVNAPDPAGTQPAGRRPANRAVATGMLRGMYNEELIKQMIEFSAGMPETVRVGQSWPVNREVPQPMIGTLILNMTNTFRGWQEHEGKKRARVEFVGTIASKEDGTADKGAVPVSISILGGTLAGHYWFAQELSMPVETAIEQNYTIRSGGANNAGGGNAPANFSFTAPVRQNVSLKLLEMKGAETP